MKKWLALVLVLVLAVVVCIAGYFWMVGTADCVVRVDTGLYGLGNGLEPNEYYVIRDGAAEQVPLWVVELIAPEAVSCGRFEDEVTTWWHAQLIYVPRVGLFDSKLFLGRNRPWITTDFGENYRIYYRHSGGPQVEAWEEIHSGMQQAAQFFHDGDPNEFISGGYDSPDRILTSFTVVSDGESILIMRQWEDLYLVMPDGTFQLVLQLPELGDIDFDYFWFPPKQFPKTQKMGKF